MSRLFARGRGCSELYKVQEIYPCYLWEGDGERVTCRKCRDAGKYCNYIDFNYAIVFLLIETHIYVCLYCYC